MERNKTKVSLRLVSMPTCIQIIFTIVFFLLNNWVANRVRFTRNLPGDQIRSEESELIGSTFQKMVARVCRGNKKYYFAYAKNVNCFI